MNEKNKIHLYPSLLSLCFPFLLFLSGTSLANEKNYIACVHKFSSCDEAVFNETQPETSPELFQTNPEEHLRSFASYSKSEFQTFKKTNPLPESAYSKIDLSDEKSSGGASGGRRCAENGSCYGDISASTGRPKTVKVDGYYRSDGTYVREHYRSKPRN